MTTDSASDDPPRTDPASWVDRYGDVLYRHALLRVRHEELAEDLVQETLLAALKARKQFAGKSTEQTWLISILRRKIVDHFRKASRSRVESINAAGEPEFFASDGRWNATLPAWRCDPQQVFERQEFWQVLELCMARLPTTIANAFILRELDRLARAEVCDELQISRSNLSVRLHRARLLLQECLQRNWFSIGD